MDECKPLACGRIRANVRDVACVAQELEGSDRSAFEALVVSDLTAARLLYEEAKLCADMEAGAYASPLFSST